MIALAKPQALTVDDYIAWSLAKDGPRADLIDGVVYEQAGERMAHLRIKHRVAGALENAIKKNGLPCEAVADGALVRISDTTAFEPDALVYCGPPLPGSAVEVPNPVIVVEVLSPESQKRDTQTKLSGYFLVPSVEHYLIIDPDDKLVIHHTRGTGEVRGTRLVRDGDLSLDPPGITLTVADLFG